MQNVYQTDAGFQGRHGSRSVVMGLMGVRKDLPAICSASETRRSVAQLVKELGISMDESEQNKIENYRVELHAFGVVWTTSGKKSVSKS